MSASDLEKHSADGKQGHISEVERVNGGKGTYSDTASDERIDALSPAEQKKVIWRIDVRLVLTLGFMYCVSLMDRTNLSVALVGGMGADLRLDIGARYSIITLVFFLTYTLLQPPATVVMRKLGPKSFLPSITILWGITTLVFGFVKSWDQLVPLRLVLGIFEAGFFPGCAYLLSTWYPRYELQKRNAVFYLIGSMAAAFSGILAFGFTQMNGLGSLGDPVYGQLPPPSRTNPNPTVHAPGIAGWRWIFIMQGLITIVIGGIGVFTIVDFPEKAAQKTRNPLVIPFLSEREAAFIVARIEKDRSDAIAEPFNLKSYLAHAADWRVWAYAMLFCMTTTQTYAIAFFLPQILAGMGFTAAAAQCLIAPPYVLAAIVMFGVAVLGDKYHYRGPWVAFNALTALVGLCILAFATNVGARYFGVFLAVTGCNANVPTVLTYQANNIRGQWKRALASATLVGSGGIGGIIGSTVFRSQDAPKYIPGMITVILASGLILIITAILTFDSRRKNKRADRGEVVIEGLEGFRYTL